MKTLRWLRLLIGVIALPVFASAETREASIAKIKGDLIAQYGSVEQSPLATGILYDLVLPLSGIESVSGVPGSEAVERARWLQIAFELRKAALVETPLPDRTTLRELGRAGQIGGYVPISILNFRYHRFAVDEGFREDAAGQVTLDREAIEEQRVFAVSPLVEKSYNGGAVRFRFDADALYFTNDDRRIENLFVDFDDGQGFRSVMPTGDEFVSYSVKGPKSLRVRAEFQDGTSLQAETRFDAVTLEAPPPTATWNITAQQSYNGQFATGQAYIYLADGHTDVVKPMVVTDGFDIGNTMFWNELYELLNQQNLIETLRGLGYDAVVLNYTDGTGYLQANAFVVMALLDTLEQVIAPEQDYVLVGPSMGGQTTKYALSWLETNAISHRVRTWISFDSPHRGANIPLGLQYWVNFFAEDSEEAAFLRDALNSPAARQMLVVHFTTPPQGSPTSDPLRATFLSELAAVGNYPSQPRLVSLINGSGNATGIGFTPGAQIIRWEYNSLLVDIRGNVWALPGAGSLRILEGLVDLIWPLPDRSQNVTVSATWPWDNAPGGTSNSMEQADQVAAPYGDIIALHPSHCFIPTISALDLNVSDPFFNPSTAPDLYSLTPFDSLYYPLVNEEHVEISPQSFWWIIDEVVDSLAAPTVVIGVDSVGARKLTWHSIPVARSYRIFETAVWGDWPETFVATADTTWIDATTGDAQKFYQVVATTAMP